jgi:hypothetical protein
VASGQSYQITPPGNRPFYCLADFEFQNAGVALPLSFDVCAAYHSAQLGKAFAGSTYVPYKLGKKDYLAVEAPVYSGGVIPATAQTRTAGLLGLVGLTTLPKFTSAIS